MIGGKKNIKYTYEVLTALGMKFFPITYHKQNGTSIVGRIHWVDTFFYDEEHDVYAIRISPEIMPLLINLTQNFTSFDIGTAMSGSGLNTHKSYMSYAASTLVTTDTVMGRKKQPASSIRSV